MTKPHEYLCGWDLYEWLEELQRKYGSLPIMVRFQHPEKGKIEGWIEPFPRVHPDKRDARFSGRLHLTEVDPSRALTVKRGLKGMSYDNHPVYVTVGVEDRWFVVDIFNGRLRKESLVLHGELSPYAVAHYYAEIKYGIPSRLTLDHTAERSIHEPGYGLAWRLLIQEEGLVHVSDKNGMDAFPVYRVHEEVDGFRAGEYVAFRRGTPPEGFSPVTGDMMIQEIMARPSPADPVVVTVVEYGQRQKMALEGARHRKYVKEGPCFAVVPLLDSRWNTVLSTFLDGTAEEFRSAVSVFDKADFSDEEIDYELLAVIWNGFEKTYCERIPSLEEKQALASKVATLFELGITTGCDWESDEPRWVRDLKRTADLPKATRNWLRRGFLPEWQPEEPKPRRKRRWKKMP